MTNKVLTALVADLVKDFGRSMVCRQLVIEGISPSTASLIARGKYIGNPRSLVYVATQRAAEKLRASAA